MNTGAGAGGTGSVDLSSGCVVRHFEQVVRVVINGKGHAR